MTGTNTRKMASVTPHTDIDAEPGTDVIDVAH